MTVELGGRVVRKPLVRFARADMNPEPPRAPAPFLSIARTKALPNPHPQDAADTTARLMLVVLSIAWGITWPFNRIALYGLPPFSMRFTTTALGTLVVFAIALVQRRSLALPPGKAWLHVAIAGTLNISGFTVLSALGQMGTTTSRVIILGYSMPIWACLMAWPILGERITRPRLLALLLCAAGIAVLVSPLASAGIPPGLMFALAAGMSWAAGTVYLKWARIHGDPLAIAGWQLFAALAVTALAVPAFESGPHLRPLQDRTIMALAFSGLIGSGLCYFLWFEVVRRLPATTASLGVLAAPVIGIAASAIALGERPTLADYIGCALILTAAACVLIVPPTRKPAALKPDVP